MFILKKINCLLICLSILDKNTIETSVIVASVKTVKTMFLLLTASQMTGGDDLSLFLGLWESQKLER